MLVVISRGSSQRSAGRLSTWQPCHWIETRSLTRTKWSLIWRQRKGKANLHRALLNQILRNSHVLRISKGVAWPSASSDRSNWAIPAWQNYSSDAVPSYLALPFWSSNRVARWVDCSTAVVRLPPEALATEPHQPPNGTASPLTWQTLCIRNTIASSTSSCRITSHAPHSRSASTREHPYQRLQQTSFKRGLNRT